MVMFRSTLHRTLTGCTKDVMQTGYWLIFWRTKTVFSTVVLKKETFQHFDCSDSAPQAVNTSGTYSAGSHITDENFARHVSKIIETDCKNGDKVIEFDPGPGILSLKLASIPDTFLTIFGGGKELKTRLRSKEISFCDIDFKKGFMYWVEKNKRQLDTENVIKKCNETRYAKMHKSIHSNLKDNLRIVGVVKQSSFLFSNNLNYALENLYFGPKFKTVLYLVIPYEVYHCLFQIKNHSVGWRLGVNISVYFNIECLASVDSSAIGTYNRHMKRKTVVNKFYLIKLTRRKMPLKDVSLPAFRWFKNV